MNSVALKQLVRFAAVIYVTVLVLAVLNFVPQFLGGEPRGVVRYRNLGAVAASYGVTLWRPASLPAPWSTAEQVVRVAVGMPDWAQTRFLAAGTDSLSACESLEATPDAGQVPELLLPAGELLQSENVTLAGHPARVRRLLLEDGVIVHELWWRAGDRNVMLRLRGSLEELMAIARQAVYENK